MSAIGHAVGHSRTSNPGPPKTSPRFNGQDVSVLRDPNLNNTQIYRDKSPWYHHAVRSPSTVEPGNWNASGPVAMSLHMRHFTYRREAGQFNSDTSGMHSMLVQQPSSANNQRKPQTMRGATANRLTTAIYRGQSYSDTTQVVQ